MMRVVAFNVLLCVSGVLFAASNELKIDPFRIRIIGQGGIHYLEVTSNRPVSKLGLERFSTAPEVQVLKKVKTSKGNFILLDYFKGYEGTGVVRACSDVYLIELLKSGKLEVRQKETYQCEYSTNSPDSEYESFQKTYTVDPEIPEIRLF